MPPVPLILTRPRVANSAFRAEIPHSLASRFQVIESPLMEISPIRSEGQMDAVAGAIFTSANGVRFAPQGAGRKAYCVGEKTAAAARAMGWDADCIGQTAAELIAHLQPVQTRTPLVHFSGAHIRADIAGALSAAGHDVRRVVLYDQRLLPLNAAAQNALLGQNPVIVPLFSPRTAAHFAAEAPAQALVVTLCLSAAVASEMDKTKGFEEVIAAEPTLSAMVDALPFCLERAAWVEGSDPRE